MKTIQFFLYFYLLISLYGNGYAQQNINYGETLTGSISTPGEVDIYVFSGNEGEKIILRLTENSGSWPLEPLLELFDPSGSLLVNVSDGAQAEIRLSLPASGVFTIFVSDDGGNDTGNYALFIQRLVNPLLATTINLGQILTGNISTDGEFDTYIFTGNEGDHLLLRLTENSSSWPLEPSIELYDPFGDSLLVASDGAQIKKEFILPFTGTYTFLVGDSYPRDDTGNYAVFLQSMINPQNFVVINSGQTLSGNISTDGDMDTYQFLGGIGDSVVIRLTENPSSWPLEPLLEVYTPSGDTLVVVSDGSQAETGIRLQGIGNYTIFASDSYPGDDTGIYSLFLFNFIASQILAIPPSIDFGEVLIGQTAIDSFMVINRGATSINIDSIRITGINLDNFVVDTSLFTLAAGDSHFIQIEFEPDTLGPYNATITVFSIGGNASVVLNGMGSTTTSIKDISGSVSKGFSLSQNYPNPFNPSTTIRFTLPRTSQVKLTVFNVLGQQVAELLNERKPVGEHSVMFDARNLSSGVYYYRLEAGDFREVKRLVLVR